jgi:carbon storage regulator
MLMLSRRCHETVRIGDNIFVTITKIGANQVKLSFDVPKSIPVHREEIYQRMQHCKTANTNSTILGQRKVANVVTDKACCD